MSLIARQAPKSQRPEAVFREVDVVGKMLAAACTGASTAPEHGTPVVIQSAELHNVSVLYSPFERRNVPADGRSVDLLAAESGARNRDVGTDVRFEWSEDTYRIFCIGLKGKPNRPKGDIFGGNIANVTSFLD